MFQDTQARNGGSTAVGSTIRMAISGILLYTTVCELHTRRFT